MLRTVRHVAVALAVACIAVTGCTQGPGTRSPSSAPGPGDITATASAPAVQAPGIAIRPSDGINLFANVDGILRFTGGCLVLDDGNGGVRYPVFEDGSAVWDGKTLTYLGKTYSIGADVHWGGGEVDDWRYSPADYGLPSTCPATRPTIINGPES